MALRLSEQRLRLVPSLPPLAAKAAEPAAASGEGGDDDGDGDLDAPFPGEDTDQDPGDFYADAMDTV
ncbi:MAG TPA: hypothetical protein VFQ68_38625 [Streptosporangiaceae bacterium]|nr:hypothetical protein [Streptosporangiaceae bacterium]